MGVKERRTKILLAFFLLSGEELKPVEMDKKFLQLFDLSFNQKTKSTLNILQKHGQVVKNFEDKNFFQLTEKGFHELCLDFPSLRFIRDTWDGKWRILSYEIPEKKREIRDKLRREVAGWGLGPWHRSFWLTPHPIIPYLQDLVAGKEEKEYVQAFESDHVFGEREVLIEKVWKKNELNSKYKELFKKWHEILSKEEDKIEKLSQIINNYVVLLRQDPGLPQELMGKSWIGFEAFRIFEEIRSILLA